MISKMKFNEFVEKLNDFLYGFFSPSHLLVTSYGRKVADNYEKAEQEIINKVFLIDSVLAKAPANRLAKYSLRNLESVINNKGNEEKIKEMLSTHEQLIQILKPYKNVLSIDQGNPIYSEDYDKKYYKLKTKFLTAA